MNIWVVYNIGALRNFGSKNQTRKNDKIHKEFELYQLFMYNFLFQTVLIFPIYILFTKRMETFWFRDISTIRGILYSGSKIHKDFWTISSLQVFMHLPNRSNISNIYIYILFPKRINTFWSRDNDTFYLGLLGVFGPKNQAKKIDKIGKDLWAISSFRVRKCIDTPKLNTTDALKAFLRKNWVFFFFLIFWQAHSLSTYSLYNAFSKNTCG